MVQTIRDRTLYHAEDLVTGTSDLSDYITTQAEVNNQTFPFVTVPLFEKVASRIRERTGVEIAFMELYLTAPDLEQWSNYSVENMWWLEESREAEIAQHPEMSREFTTNPIIPFPHEFTFANRTSWLQKHPDGPWDIMWMSSPAYAQTPLINYDAQRSFEYGPVREAAKKLNRRTFGPVRDIKQRGLFFIEDEVHEGYHDELIPRTDKKEIPSAWTRPHIHLYQPLFDSNFAPQTQVGLLVSIFSLDRYMVGLLEGTPSPITVVVSNNCNQSYTYTIRGREVRDSIPCRELHPHLL